VCASNRELAAAVAAGEFREDLFHRINTVPIVVPTLRERLEDIPELVQALVRRANREAGTSIHSVEQAALERLKAHAWPGNVRELENVIQRAMVVAEGDTVSAHHLGLDASLPQDMGAPMVVMMAVSAADESQSLLSGAEREPEASLASRRVIQEAELILETLKASPTKTSAAARLGISERTLRYKLARMREHGLVAAEL
jgi:two-component system response regulator FlrC